MTINKKKKAVVFFWDGWISTSPSITNTLLLLAKNGYEVDCISNYPGHEFAEEIKFPKEIKIYRHGKPHIPINNTQKTLVQKPIQSFIYKIKSALGLSNIRSNFLHNRSIMKRFQSYISFSKKITSNQIYDLVIGVDTFGLAAAGKVMKSNNAKFVYYSLELHFLKEYKYKANKIIKRLEKKYHKKCDITIIQDKYRLEALYRENNLSLDMKKALIIPNSPIGISVPMKSNYFRNMFKLTEKNIIILHAGGLSQGYMNEEVATAAASFPDNWKLIFHFAEFLEMDNPQIQKLASLSGNKANFSLKPVPFDKLEEITNSADIGIVFYNKNRGLNHSLIVGASGKLANYMRSGLPVIALNLPGFKELFNEYKGGVVIENWEETNYAINIILENYEKFRNGAYKCFDEVYEFEKHFNLFLEKL